MSRINLLVGVLEAHDLEDFEGQVEMLMARFGDDKTLELLEVVRALSTDAEAKVIDAHLRTSSLCNRRRPSVKN